MEDGRSDESKDARIVSNQHISFVANSPDMKLTAAKLAATNQTSLNSLTEEQKSENDMRRMLNLQSSNETREVSATQTGAVAKAAQ